MVQLSVRMGHSSQGTEMRGEAECKALQWSLWGLCAQILVVGVGAVESIQSLDAS